MKIAMSKEPAKAAAKRPSTRKLRPEGRSLIETWAPPAWRLPGGMRLAEYALRGGFVASSLLPRSERES
jgi:hypothetical protein